MAEAYLRQSPLASLGLERRAQAMRGEAGVAMAERPFRGILDLRGDAGDEAFTRACAEALGFELPLEPNTTAGGGRATAFWLGPDEWWIVTPAEAPDHTPQLAAALAGQACALTELGDSRCCISLAGPRARDLLAKGCPLDLHPRVFGAGRCAQSLVAKAGVTLYQVSDEPAYQVYVLRSFAEYLWLWLEDGAREYGLTVLHG